MFNSFYKLWITPQYIYAKRDAVKATYNESNGVYTLEIDDMVYDAAVKNDRIFLGYETPLGRGIIFIPDRQMVYANGGYDYMLTYPDDAMIEEAEQAIVDGEWIKIPIKQIK